METLYILVTATVGFFLIGILVSRKRKRALEFPGPLGWPFIGSFFEMRGKPTHKLLTTWAKQYGGAYKFSIFGQQYLVVSNPDTIKEVLVSRGKAYAGRHDSYRATQITKNLNVTHDDHLGRHSVLKKAVQSCVKTYGGGRTKLAATLNTALQLLVDSLEKTCGQPFDPADSIYKATSLTVFLLLCGEQPGDVDALAQDLQELNLLGADVLAQNAGNLLLDAAPWLRHLPWFPPYKLVLQYNVKRDGIYDSIVWPALDRCRNSEEKTLGKALLDIVGQKYGEGKEAEEITMANVKFALIDFMIAGTITTSPTLYALLNVLQHHQDIQEKAYQEVITNIGCERTIELDDRDKLPYCRAILQEILRYFTVASLGIGHVTKENTSLAGKQVPNGTEVLTNLWGCHHDPDLWGDPWTFRPERFLDDDGQLVPADHINRKQWFPFGAGPRVCAGEVLALNRLFIFLTNCLQRFQFLPPDGADAGSCDSRNCEYSLLLTSPSYLTRAVPRNKQLITAN